MKVPTGGAMRFLTEMRTRSGASVSRPSILWTRTTMRSERSRSSRTSTKPEIETFQAAVLQDRMRDARAFQRDDRKAGGRGGERKQDRERDRPRARQHGRERKHACQRRGRPERRFAVGREIENDAEAETDRQPGHQPPGRDIGRKPARQNLARATERARA